MRAGRGSGGFRSSSCPTGYNFEGAGDALFCGETLIGGYRFRSDVTSHHWIGERLGVEVLPLELIDPRFYHLDTCFCPLAPDLALYYPGAFDEYGRSVLRDRIPHLIEVAIDEAVSFSCNAVVVGKTVILNDGAPSWPKPCANEASRVQLLGFSEFIKSGGSAKCLTLRVDGEEAASWKRSPRVTITLRGNDELMTDLYIVRHGIAVEPGTPGIADDERPLTPKGEKRMRQIARGLRKLDLKLDRIITSPLPRAARRPRSSPTHWMLAHVLETSNVLQTGSSAATVQRWLRERPEERLMIVGHNPTLSDLVSLLVLGSTQPRICDLKKGGIAALTHAVAAKDLYDVTWLATPRLVRGLLDGDED